MSGVRELLKIIVNEPFVFIQCHDFPDHDAVASAFGLHTLLLKQSITSRIIYAGCLQRDSLIRMIEKLGIPIKHVGEYSIKKKDKIIIVDGCKGNKNVTDLVGDEIAIIDHHELQHGTLPEDLKFRDIRSQYGACASIIFDYYKELEIDIPHTIASALLMGILIDTALMTRGVDIKDLEAYSTLYKLSDIPFVNNILRNKLQVKDLDFYKTALNRVKISRGVAFCYFDEGCNQNLLGIIGDFFLSLQEVEFVFLCAKNSDMINFSVRSESEKWNAAWVIQEILKNEGFGGGHSDMAGGILEKIRYFDEKKYHSRLLEYLGVSKNR